MYITLYIHYTQNFKEYIKFFIFTIHNISKQCTQYYKIEGTHFFKKCIQLFTFNVHNFSTNIYDFVKCTQYFDVEM